MELVVKARHPCIALTLIFWRVLGFSAAAGLKIGQYDRKRNFEKANIEYRIMNVEGMYSVYFIKD